MEPEKTTVEAIAENVIEAVEEVASVTANPIQETMTKPVTPTAHEIAAPIAVTNSTKVESDATNSDQLNNEQVIDLWKQVTKLWDEYFGEGKKANLTLVLTILATIPVLIATSTLLEFLNKLPLLPSIFELVGFGYSAWFVYRYLLLANTRKELTDTISGWKNKVLG
ncbi:CAAD domain-containing protein [Pseudanabaena mucicola]|uniref:CAAD domain-containing protein n=1 Tax=Pseudanabaena mucicola FACHB-723 TaxID=2692860 RepID=A0ABR7ZZ27_9CYAN|nr:CAAD domain-containing protein [Pseudanabaena mucicola]MBD2188829.1 CAAD domain-containing protein [Pseudanabaena mucicola FACHB-723]